MKQAGLTIMLIMALAVVAHAGGGYSMPITVAGYTNRTETLTNFPVLVAFSNNVAESGFDYNTFLSEDGYDLRFVTNLTDQTSLNYEIEHWNTNGTSYVWVQVPELPPDGSGSLWATWGDFGDRAQLPCTTNGATWSNGYALVLHMNQTSGTAVKDSTSADRSAAITGTYTWQAEGAAGPALRLHGDLFDLITISPQISVASTPYTISAWFSLIYS